MFLGFQEVFISVFSFVYGGGTLYLLEQPRIIQSFQKRAGHQEDMRDPIVLASQSH